jgi:hypothetical protein
MNIFFLSMVPRRAAQWHCDKHVVKMILESVQMLWTTHHVTGLDSAAATELKPYKPVHRNHPCTIWVRASIANYRWLCCLAAELVMEYHWRFPKGRSVHACEPHLRWLTAHEPRIPEGPLTWPALAMPDEYKRSPNPTACYRAYYLGAKQHILLWTGRDVPSWVSCERLAVSG